MMPLENQVVLLDLAKRLKELGFKQDSLFNWNIYDEYKPKVQEFGNFGGSPKDMSPYLISAYTVAELGEMLPENSFHSGITNRYSKPHIKKWSISVNKYSNLFRIKGLNFDDKLWTKVHNDTLNIFEDTEADARAKMLIYLKENNLI